jgi:hypothetical protein
MMQGSESDVVISNDDLALQCASEQAVQDMPYVEVDQAYLFRKIVEVDQQGVDLVRAPGTPVTGDRWYVEVELRHRGDSSEAAALYRVWREHGTFLARRVAIE